MARVEVASKVRNFTDIAIANTAATYAATRQVGSLITIPGVFRIVNRTGLLVTMTMVDNSNQAIPYTVLFFRALPTITSTNNTTPAITTAELRAKFIGFVDIPSSAFLRLNANAVATVTNIGLNLESTDANAQSLYALVVTAGTVTFASANQLFMSLSIVQD